MSVIVKKSFNNINLADPFFDTLKRDYAEFETWFNRKADDGHEAFVLEDESAQLQGFLYLKEETDAITDVEPHLPAAKRLKVGTFKINPHGTRLGERFVKKIFDVAIQEGYKEIYVTVFEHHGALINILSKYGFENFGTKTTGNGKELVLLKNLSVDHGDILLDYPRFRVHDTRKYVLSIYPEFHSNLFPDSLLNNESFNILEDVSHTNSIHKVYICFMKDIGIMNPGDLVLIYRTADDKGPAHYRSVVTSVCTVEEVKTRGDFHNSIDEYLDYCRTYSIFAEPDLIKYYNRKGHLWVIKMLYNAAFTRRITKGRLMEKMGGEPNYWGFFDLTDEQFTATIRAGQVNESYIIH